MSDNPSNEEKKNLPAIVTRVGGALELVISRLEMYEDARFPIDRVNQIALAKVVEAKPDLNNENDLAFIVDSLSYHGISRQQRKNFYQLIDLYGAQQVNTALEYLVEMGVRDRGDAAQFGRENSLAFVRSVLERIVELEEKGFGPVTIESLAESQWSIDDYLDASDFAYYDEDDE
jgi:hypothetical protein